MSRASVLLNPESSSCLLISYKQDTYILKLGEELQELMREDLEQILKQEGVVYKHLTLPLKDCTGENIRQYGGVDERTSGIMRQVITKNDGPFRRESKSRAETQEKYVQTEKLTEDVDLYEMRKEITNLAKSFHELKVNTVIEPTLKNQQTDDVPVSVTKIEPTMCEAENVNKENLTPKKSNYCQFCCNALLPKSGRQVAAEIRRLTKNCSGQNILLAVVYEPENYHINVISISTGLCLGCVLATESGFSHVETQLKLADCTTFYISPQGITNSADNRTKFDAYFQYIREANKNKRLRDEMKNKR